MRVWACVCPCVSAQLTTNSLHVHLTLWCLRELARLAPECLTLCSLRLACSAHTFFLGPRLVRNLYTFTPSSLLNSGLSQYFLFPLYKLLKSQSTLLGIIEGWVPERHLCDGSIHYGDFPTRCLLDFSNKKSQMGKKKLLRIVCMTHKQYGFSM